MTEITRRMRFGFWVTEWGFRMRGVWRSLRGDYPTGPSRVSTEDDIATLRRRVLSHDFMNPK